jgi:hypothetical protein
MCSWHLALLVWYLSLGHCSMIVCSYSQHHCLLVIGPCRHQYELELQTVTCCELKFWFVRQLILLSNITAAVLAIYCWLLSVKCIVLATDQHGVDVMFVVLCCEIIDCHPSLSADMWAGLAKITSCPRVALQIGWNVWWMTIWRIKNKVKKNKNKNKK